MTTLITGGAKGGSSMARLYTSESEAVIIADIDEESGRALAEELRAGGHEASYQHIDVTSHQSVREALQEISKERASIEHVISLAGGAHISEWQGLSGMNPEDIDSTIQLNLMSHLYVMREAKGLLAASRQSNKSITLMGSINGYGAWGLPVYSACKAALTGLMNGAAHEFTSGHGIRINVLAPGTVPSERTLEQPKDFTMLKEHSLLKEHPHHEELAEAAYSISHRLPHMTQQVLVIDSGQTAWAPDYHKEGSR